MVTQFKIFLLTTILLIPSVIFAHKVTLEDKTLEEIVKNRMALMQKIKSTSSQISKLLMSDDFNTIIELNNTLLDSAKEFKDHFPEGTQYKTAKDEIWNDRDIFNQYIDKFINDIEMIALSIELEDNEMLNDSFKEMAANCGSCHKKFKN
tara:strand:+ start:71 stop:520 length:450 start_codon:yes stop_codon:yes gene_type:complete